MLFAESLSSMLSVNAIDSHRVTETVIVMKLLL